MKEGPDRIRCEVIGCRRTFKRRADEPADSVTMCNGHFRTGNPRDVKLYRLCHRRLKRTMDPLERRRLERIASRAWWRVLEDANAGAVGIR